MYGALDLFEDESVDLKVWMNEYNNCKNKQHVIMIAIKNPIHPVHNR